MSTCKVALIRGYNTSGAQEAVLECGREVLRVPKFKLGQPIECEHAEQVRLSLAAACTLEAWVQVAHEAANNRGTPLHNCQGERCGILAALREVNAEKRRLRPQAYAVAEAANAV